MPWQHLDERVADVRVSLAEIQANVRGAFHRLDQLDVRLNVQDARANVTVDRLNIADRERQALRADLAALENRIAWLVETIKYALVLICLAVGLWDRLPAPLQALLGGS